MKTQTIGSVAVEKITEYVEQLSPSFVLCDFDPSILSENENWLFPYFIDPSNGNFNFSFHSFLLKTPDYNILVDTCVGNDKARPLPQWNMRRGNYLEKIDNHVDVNEIDYVMCTHLHADHVGWNTRLENGSWVPTFPNAKYIFSKADYDHFNRVKSGEPGYQSMIDSVQPIVDAGQALIVGNDFNIGKEISLLPTPGHTPGHYCVHIDSEDNSAILSGDLIHHPLQIVRPDWRTNFCNDPLLACETRKSFVNRYVDSGVILFAAHFAEPTVGLIASHHDKIYFYLNAEEI